jgi:hypothetical protein
MKGDMGESGGKTREPKTRISGFFYICGGSRSSENDDVLIGW